MDDELTNATPTTTIGATDIATVLAENVRIRQRYGSIAPIAVKLSPHDIAALEAALLDRTVVVEPNPTFPIGAAMRISGLPVYPDADVPRGESRWVYADEVL